MPIVIAIQGGSSTTEKERVLAGTYHALGTVGRNRRRADVAERGLGRLNWADSALTRAASGRTGVREIAVIADRLLVGLIPLASCATAERCNLGNPPTIGGLSQQPRPATVGCWLIASCVTAITDKLGRFVLASATKGRESGAASCVQR